MRPYINHYDVTDTGQGWQDGDEEAQGGLPVGRRIEKVAEAGGFSGADAEESRWHDWEGKSWQVC